MLEEKFWAGLEDSVEEGVCFHTLTLAKNPWCEEVVPWLSRDTPRGRPNVRQG